MRDEPSVAGVVLAAGLSSRMGRNKLLLELDGTPLVRRSVLASTQAGLQPTIVVLGHEATEVGAALDGLGCETILNLGYEAGMRSSLALGLDRVPAQISAAVVLLADMPRVTAAMVSSLVERHRREPGLLIVGSRYGEMVAPPLLFDRGVFHDAARSGGACRGAELIVGLPDRSATITWDAALLADVDVPEDFVRLQGS